MKIVNDFGKTINWKIEKYNGDTGKWAGIASGTLDPNERTQYIIPECEASGYRDAYQIIMYVPQTIDDRNPIRFNVDSDATITFSTKITSSLFS